MIKNKLYLIIILVVVIFLIIGFFTYRYFNQSIAGRFSVIVPEQASETISQAQLENDVVNFSKAQENINIDDCLLITDKQSKNYCIKELAIITQDSSFCSVISGEELRVNCNNTVLIEKAVTNKNITDCQKINSLMVARTCIERIASNDIKTNCNLITDQDLQNTCLSILYYQQAIKENNDKICIQIPEPIQRANCLSELKKIDLHSDSDKDGLDFLQEIINNTDPNNKDSDSDGHLDGEELANGFNPDGSGLLPQPEPVNIIICKDIKDEEIKAACIFELKNEPLNLLTCKDLNTGILKDFCLKSASSIVK